MISVNDALERILEDAQPLGIEQATLSSVSGRIAAEDLIAKINQPPFPASAMDGYAVRFEDASVGNQLRVIGEAPAGMPFSGNVSEMQAVRILTGGVVPNGADHIVIQEDVSRSGDVITINEKQDGPRHIRKAGIDFSKGDTLAGKGEYLHEVHGSIFAAANLSSAPVFRRPRLAIFSNGDELIEPGDRLEPGQIINSNHYAISALTESWGGKPDYLGCIPDSENAVIKAFKKASGADVIVPIGGASVGDYDFVKSAFKAAGGKMIFEKVAVRPGKPTWFGGLGRARVVGLPGNPASAIVIAALFLQPLVRRLGGDYSAQQFQSGRLTKSLGANGKRESYLRATMTYDGADAMITPADNQDSSLLLPFAKANVLIRRRAGAPALKAGDEAEFIRLR